MKSIKHKKRIWAFLALTAGSLAGWQAALANPIVVDSGNFYLMLGSEVQFLETAADTFTLKQVLEMPDSAFERRPKPGFFFGLQDKGFWLRFRLRTKNGASLIFEMANPYIEEFQFFVCTEAGLQQADTLGADFVFQGRPHPHRNWQIPIILPPTDSALCLLHIPPARSPLQFDLYLWNFNKRLNQQYRESAILTAFFLTMLVYLALIILVNLVAQFRSLWYYCAYVALGALLLFSSLGLSYYYLWPDSPFFHKASELLISNLYLLAGLQFVRTYFGTARYFPALNRMMITTMGISAAFIPFAAGLPYAPLRFAHLLHLLHYLVFMAGFILALGVFIMSIVKRQRIQAGWFLFGFSLHGLGIALTILQYIGWFPFVSSSRWFYNMGFPLTFFPQMAMMAGMLIEVPVLFYVAFHRFRSLYENAQRQAASRENNLNNLVMSIENERQRLGQDLHDSLGVQLAAIRMKLSIVQDKAPQEQRQELGQVIESLDQAHREMRAISHGLMLPSLERQGLASAVEHLLQRIQSARPGLKTRFFNNAPLDHLTPRARIHLYRILSELITNSVKHGAAQELTVQLTHYDGHIQVTVEDDGAGFDPGLSKGKGIGLSNVEYRAKALGGRFNLDARPGRGTFASVEVPLARAAGVWSGS
ncbi:MAG: hypothetical protein H6558_20110 [Lewinellaceae bacterium]|nr:hypothetical protein [Lewinellaceae bacterium]